MAIRPVTFQRPIDLAVSLPALLVALPLCAILLLLIRLETPGAPLFVQERVGRNRKVFRMLKLRTMRQGTAHAASHQVGAASITRLGAVLRKLKLDELPQLWNVVVGDMGLVGPRPCLPLQEELIGERDRRGLFIIRPGVTGPAQLAGIDMSEPARLAEVEAEYFERDRGFGDLSLLVHTFFGGGRGDAARRQ